MLPRLFGIFFALLIIIVNLGNENAFAMPMFARKYKLDCAMCHAAVPRLNYTGFKFKAAGYRMPWEVGKAQSDDLLKLENYTAFVSFLTANVGATSNTTPAGTAQLNAQELDLHPITGSWGQNFSSGFEADLLPGGSVSLNQAFLGYTVGSSDTFWTTQAGVMPNFFGFGPLDRPIAVSTPLILSTSASDPLNDTLFSWANPRAAGVTSSVWFGNTYLSASFRNRLADSNGSIDALGTPSTNHMGDVLLSATQFYDQKGSGSALSLAYYHGQTHLPLPDGSGGYYANNFNHVIGAANYYVTDHINLIAGVGWGQDQTEDLISGSTQNGLYSAGEFGGIEYFWNPKSAVGARYDYYRSDLNTGGTTLTEATLYYHYRPINQVILSGEYQFQNYGPNATQFPGMDQSTIVLQVLLAF